MDPSPKSFPFLSYVLSRLPIPTSPKSPADLEQPPIPTPPPGAAAAFPDQIELVVDGMPHLDRRPSLLASMTAAVSNVAQTRSVLRALGDRPDHEAVDAARARLAEIDSEMAVRSLDQQPELRDALADEKAALKAVIQLDEMHEAYGNLLREAEERLERMYRDGGEGSTADAPPQSQQEEEVQENEEVIAILQEGLTKPVEWVDLSGRQLRILPEAFGKLQGLISLNLSNNLLEVIPDSIAGLEHLQELYLSSNVLISLPDSIGLLSKLRILDVSNNKLKVLPDSISKCRSLVELDASYNELEYLPTDIGYELLNLEKLCIHLNKIRSLPSSVCEMRALRHLDAHFNQIRGLPQAFGKLINLEYLNLNSNFSDMQELPDSFCDLINLKELDLSNNQIHVLPDRFGRLEKLAKLNLEQNPLTIPPPEVVNAGAEAVKAYMLKRYNEILLEEERKKAMAAETSPRMAGWLTRSTSWLNNWVSGVSEGVNELLGTPKAPKDPALDEVY